MKRVGNYVYCLPTFQQARRVIWDSITNDGTRFLDCIPKELVKSMNQAEMKITLINGSMIQLAGSDTYNTSLVGTNPVMVIFSEFALSDGMALAYTRPILVANDGTLIILSTPRGIYNSAFYDLYQIAKDQSDWFVSKLTIEDTKHVDIEVIKKQIETGELDEGLAQQEWFTDFQLGIEGSYYCKYLDRMILNGQVGTFGWDSSLKVHTAWDLGVSDKTIIIFFQYKNGNIYIIDLYSNKDVGLEHYVKELQQKPYIYGKHFAPHDIAVREWAGGAVTRIEKARQLGINFIVAPKLSISDGIEAVRTMLLKTNINESRCKDLLKALEFYRKEFDSKRKVYQDRPYHDQHSDFCDCARYLAISLPMVKDGTSPEELERRYREAVFGGDSNLPGVFR